MRLLTMTEFCVLFLSLFTSFFLHEKGEGEEEGRKLRSAESYRATS